MYFNIITMKTFFFNNRPSGVRMKAPTMKDVLDLDQENVYEPQPLRITAPPPPTPSRLVHYKDILMSSSTMQESEGANAVLHWQLHGHILNNFVLLTWQNRLTL